MAAIELNKSNFKETYEKNDIVIIDFWAAWCGPCMNFAPIYDKVSEKYTDVVFGKVDTEVEVELAQHFTIRSIPTLVVIREGYELFYQPGALAEETLIELVEKVKALDMEEVKKQMDAEDAQSENE
ncbi:MAG: thioredoxin [Bdellovibrionales bacterium]|nr:thioredoxin [Bdellovibrionales bacterium]NQZ18813.1 thioredoxin [Bdellovibrionales bacterium]